MKIITGSNRFTFWFIGSCLYILLNQWIEFYLLIIVIPALIIWTIVLIFTYLSKFKRLDKPGIVELIMIISTCTLIMFTPISRLGIYTRAYVDQFKIRSILNEVKKGDMEACKSNSCIIDKGPPVRVALIWSGIIDNWSGLCYDPTGIVLKSNLLKSDFSNMNDSEYRLAGKLFYGDMVQAIHLWADLYYCSFT